MPEVRRVEMDIKRLADAFLTFESMRFKKLILMCYFANAWHYAMEGEPLIDTEFKAYAKGAFNEKLYKSRGSDMTRTINKHYMELSELIKDDDLQNLINQIYRIYGHLDSLDLTLICVQHDGYKKSRGDIEPWASCHNPVNLEYVKEDLLNEYEGSGDESKG